MVPGQFKRLDIAEVAGLSLLLKSIVSAKSADFMECMIYLQMKPNLESLQTCVRGWKKATLESVDSQKRIAPQRQLQTLALTLERIDVNHSETDVRWTPITK